MMYAKLCLPSVESNSSLTLDLTMFSQGKHPAGDRLKTLSQQEMLIEQKRKEILAKLEQRRKERDGDSSSSLTGNNNSPSQADSASDKRKAQLQRMLKSFGKKAATPGAPPPSLGAKLAKDPPLHTANRSSIGKPMTSSSSATTSAFENPYEDEVAAAASPVSAKPSTSSGPSPTDSANVDWTAADAIAKDVANRGEAAEEEARSKYADNPAIGGPSTSTIGAPIGRSDPQLIAYAVRVYGNTNLTEEQWKQCEDQIKLGLVYKRMLEKKQERERLARQGKNKYEYDSDEEIDGGTWEHKTRMQEMTDTKEWAEQLTKQAKGKHHIGDFLPPEEMTKFMEKLQALKEGRDPDFSDFKEFKLQADNIGYQMLQKLGWTEGMGLGSEGKGITVPVNKAVQKGDNSGLGIDRPEELKKEDDEYEAYRKRMMLAYRFRPNPLVCSTPRMQAIEIERGTCKKKGVFLDVLEEDVRLAEEKTAGNPGILLEIETELEREEQESPANIKTIFPTPVTQKKKKKSEEGSKKKGHRSVPALSDERNKVPLKDKPSEISYMVSGGEVNEEKSTESMHPQTWKCPECNFSTSRFDNFTFHQKVHRNKVIDFSKIAERIFVPGVTKTPPSAKKRQRSVTLGSSSRKSSEKKKKKPESPEKSAEKTPKAPTKVDNVRKKLNLKPAEDKKELKSPKKRKLNHGPGKHRGRSDVTTEHLRADWEDEDEAVDDDEEMENLKKVKEFQTPEKLESTFEALLAETAVPTIPSLPPGKSPCSTAPILSSSTSSITSDRDQPSSSPTSLPLKSALEGQVDVGSSSDTQFEEHCPTSQGIQLNNGEENIEASPKHEPTPASMQESSLPGNEQASNQIVPELPVPLSSNQEMPQVEASISSNWETAETTVPVLNQETPQVAAERQIQSLPCFVAVKSSPETRPVKSNREFALVSAARPPLDITQGQSNVKAKKPVAHVTPMLPITTPGTSEQQPAPKTQTLLIPHNTQPGSTGSTYLLVTVDEGGKVQAISAVEDLEVLEGQTLLAIETADTAEKTEGGTDILATALADTRVVHSE
ncbi:unnamed protein product [Darwinula stevensoni]|uniref:G-patch domain-containing protein n=1 Tax=Darwinula stevensoni TaxID=69355 RepID=A0A7R8X2A8_9CRUS|nr:unnamed protein product [Darwinula stevensoni]CAG0881017.1 unnamed protein product [Darwinula stevensoni]